MNQLSLPRLSVSVVLIICAFASCAIAAPKVGLVVKGRTQFWTALEDGAKASAQKNGLELIVKSPLSEDNVPMQIQLLNALAGQGIEALVIVPSNPKALFDPLQNLSAKGIKIVVVDSEIEGAKWTFVGTDQNAAGKAAGALIANNSEGSDTVAFFKASETQNGGATEQREKGAMDALRKAKPGISIVGNVYSGSIYDIALERAGILLDRYPKAKFVYASASVGTLAMLQKIEERKLTGSIKLVGVGFNLRKDVAAAIDSGAMFAWIAQLPSEVGAKAVEAAGQLIKGESVPAVINPHFFVVTKENLHNPEIQALLKL